MVDLGEIQRKLNRVACPMCGASTLDVTLRCDLGYGECLATALCRTCRTSYEISTERKALEQGRGALGSSQCPHCGGGDLEPEIRCDLPSRRCFYVAGCRKCREPFLKEVV